ncbi:MAG: PhnD/SsuA/transferrin family substrate-binding protein [Candidatus Riflebacteria bacterium]|nr:PhnD/SsuA/transferrin family substrate-binding protein [Candidatus Riflebacteria bacterium]
MTAGRGTPGVLVMALSGLLLAGVPAGGGTQPQPDSAPLILGALRFYESTARNQDTYDLLMGALRSRGLNVYPRAVQGSYADLVDWISKGKIDLASMPAVTFQLARALEPRLTPLCTVLRRGPGGLPVDHTTSMIVARKGRLPAEWKALERLRVSFASPLSSSGYLFPLSVLKGHGVAIPEPHRFAGGHERALALLLDGKGAGDVDAVVVSSLAFDALSELSRSRLDARPFVDASGRVDRIPNDVIVARASLPRAVSERVRAELTRYDGRALTLNSSTFDAVLGVVGFRAYDGNAGVDARELKACELLKLDRYGIDDVLDAIEVDVEFKKRLGALYSRPFVPRLALIFAGGGAAGSFQAGAAMEVARALARRRVHPDIIVGTSVGAINGTVFALGRSDVLEPFWAKVCLGDVLNVPDREFPVGAWKLLLLSLAQRAPGLLTVILVAGAGYLEFLAFCLLLWPLRIGLRRGVGLCLALVATLWLANCDPSTLLTVSVLLLLAAVAAVEMLPRLLAGPWGRRVAIAHAALLIAVLGVVSTEVVRVLSNRDGLFSHRRLYGTLGRMFLHFRGVPLSNLTPADFKRRIEEESVKICSERLPSTLVISTTDYENHRAVVFFLGSNRQITDRARELGYLPIASACPEKLLDVLLASSSVFPILRPRLVALRDGRTLKLVDGSFIHNNPVRVAVDLGATHALILKPSEEKPERGLARAGTVATTPAGKTGPSVAPPGHTSLVSSCLEFLASLIPRTQLEDLKAGEEVTSYLLSPDPAQPGVGLLEFDGHFGSGAWPWDRPQITLSEFLQRGRNATSSRVDGFRQWSRGTFQLPPAP